MSTFSKPRLEVLKETLISKSLSCFTQSNGIEFRRFQAPWFSRLQGQAREVFFLLRTLDVENQGDRTLRNVGNSTSRHNKVYSSEM